MIAVSGGFDILHIGHVRLFQEALKYDSVLVVILNSDAWLIRKKGYIVMPWEERAEILKSIRYISDVIPVDDSDNSVSEALMRLKPDYFANGGDRIGPDPAEHFVCQRHLIQEIYGVGGEKIQSSSELAGRVP